MFQDLSKELFNPMGFDPCNRFIKIWEFIGIPIPKMGVHLGSVKVHSLTFSYIPRNIKCDS